MAFWCTITDSAAKKKAKHKFGGYKIGRIRPSPGSFEYQELNGRYRPNEARDVCERDLGCAGFTFKGSRAAGVDAMTFFFHYVPTRDDLEVAAHGARLFHWTSYRVKRIFVVLLGQFRNVDKSAVAVKELDKVAKLADIVTENNAKAAGDVKWSLKTPIVEYDLFSGEAQAVTTTSVDFSNLEKTADKTDKLVFISLQDATLVVVDTRNKIDTCCQSIEDANSVQTTDFSPIAKIDCQTTKSTNFLRDYVLAHRPVLLVSCSASCPILNWTVSDVVNTFDDFYDAQWQLQLTDGSGLQRMSAEETVKALNAATNRVNLAEGVMTSAESGHRMLSFVLDHDDGDMVGPKVIELFDLAGFTTNSKKLVYARKGRGKRALVPNSRYTFYYSPILRCK